MAAVKSPRRRPYLAFLFCVLAISIRSSAGAPDYADALSKCLLFYEGQRSGKLPSAQRLTWRKDSGLQDGQDAGVDLSGGYYDAGDNVKFGFPMAFTATMLAWSIVEFASEMGSELSHAQEALRWNTDYLLKATAQTDKVFVQVGDANADHNCWERPEDMDTPRSVYAVDASHPGSDVAAETAAALAAASIAFRSSDAAYADTLLTRAKSVYDFANKYQGSYSQSVGQYVCPFYCDSSGYQDELVWGGAWLNRATNTKQYQRYIIHGIQQIHLLEGGDHDTEFGWADKHAGSYVLLASSEGKDGSNAKLAQEFACTMLPDSPTKSVKYTPGGLLFETSACNMQDVTAHSFLLVVFARHLTNVNGTVTCGNVQIPPSKLIDLAKTQVDYLLGNNPHGMSYMVGYGTKFPQHIHHRGSSVPSIAEHPEKVACKDGTPYYQSKDPNPNLLTGAVVGGPNDGSDNFADSRQRPDQSEPTTYVNAPLTGVLAYFSKNG